MDIQEYLNFGVSSSAVVAFLGGDAAALLFTRLFGSRGTIYLWAARTAAWYIKAKRAKKQKPTFDNQLKEALTGGTFTTEGESDEPEIPAAPVAKPVPAKRQRSK